MQSNTTNLVSLALKKLRLDGGTQPRAAMSDVYVVELADVLEAGGVLPPVIVFFDGRSYWLADGFHRYRAHESAGQKHMFCDVRKGTQRDAILYSVGANEKHGMRRTNEDKHHAVETLLRDPEWNKWTNAEIARRAGVSPPFVAGKREELSRNGLSSPDTRNCERNGTTFQIDTGNIGGIPGELREFRIVDGQVPIEVVQALRALPKEQQLAIIEAAEAGAIEELAEEIQQRPGRKNGNGHDAGPTKRCPMCRGKGVVPRAAKRATAEP